ncbi:CSS-motif domain-containing protein [Aeromonas salmonicida]|uniref:EAL domain-containing protein n=1 Tax=Aeromonas salmonicida subsp. salmonicida 01-B526 TaxID=1076135 RepID=A0ABN0E311_AERSS|nr:CSS-motif domain-containing protein [Aeromonas salmonicida]EHI53562.1 EAL domain-containing protein [Aeromonas salmonicida subsp. salmonicida 01-B526]MCR4452233.1 CSS-motif domain-containing protein [Aeromonas salmonicida]UYZ30524.1 CSS-motif domain-containing protein [Aeromonas salmonicida subsp. salmonicida]WCB48718.1 CSS-motif domain-containing protein [Aeromonas salmonicida subsp. salmonicida]WCB53027.1 CSS-motif domain-containing protein [Aeromonas salmonicida subsp. salmonicida]
MALSFLRSGNMPRLLASLLCCATLILVSLATLYWQTWSMTRQQAQNAAERAMVQIDSALYHSTQAARAALPLVGRPCHEVARELRVLVATSPYLCTLGQPLTPWSPLLLFHLRRDQPEG